MFQPSKSYFYLRRLRLNSSGYTDQGEYYGTGAPLYEAWSDFYSFTLRATSRDAAKAQVLKRFPNARFYK